MGLLGSRTNMHRKYKDMLKRVLDIKLVLVISIMNIPIPKALRPLAELERLLYFVNPKKQAQGPTVAASHDEQCNAV